MRRGAPPDHAGLPGDQPAVLRGLLRGLRGWQRPGAARHRGPDHRPGLPGQRRLRPALTTRCGREHGSRPQRPHEEGRMSTTVATRRPRARRQETVAGWAMIAPAAIGLLLFVLLPFLLAGWLSTQNVRLDTPQPPTWFGLEHYRRILLDPDFRGEFLTGLRNNLIFAAVVVPVQTSLRSEEHTSELQS